jgi:uncharacterized protein
MPKPMVAIYRGQDLILSRVKVARNFWQRVRGLMFYRDFPRIDGLLLYPCNFVQMLWMRFPVDLIYLTREKEVLFTVDVLVPYKLGPLIQNAYFVLEIPAGICAAKSIKIGDRMWW